MTLTIKTATQAIFLWGVVCLIGPVILFSGIGHGSIFYIQPVWFLAATGGILQCLFFVNHQNDKFIVKALLLAIISSLFAAALMAIFWGKPILSIFSSEVNYIFIVLFAFAIPLSILVSRFIKNRAVFGEKGDFNLS
jgi:hypothetical protein